MAVSRVKSSSVLQGFPKYRSMLAGNAGFDPAATWLIQRVNISTNTTSVTFSGIPSTYSSLQLRILSASTRAASANLNVQVNSATGSVYTRHELNGDGTTVTASATATAGGVTSASIARSTGGDSGSNIYAASIIDIHDYASTTKNKTMRSFFGINNNGLSTENVTLRSVLYIGTDAITSLTFTSASSTSFIAGSTFALYGIK